MLAMVSYSRRLKSGQITCYLNRTYDVLPTGIYYALDPDTGALLWKTQVGPGSSLGGMEWGSATDGNRIYVAIANL